MVDFVATGGYALRVYDRFARIVKGQDGLWRARNQETILRHRLNVGAIVSAERMNVRLVGRQGQPGRKIGEVEEGYLELLEIGDTFIFAGGVWRLQGITGLDVLVTAAPGEEAKLPTWGGSKFALSTFLAGKVRRMMSDPSTWAVLPGDVREWLELQRDRSLIPGYEDMLLETFPQRPPALPGLLPVRGPPRPHHALHAAHPAAGAARGRAAGLRRQRLCAGGVGAEGHGRPRFRRRCSPRTCWATTSRPGWTRAR